MTEENAADTAGGLTRRSALIRIGAGAAVAWSAPAILSVASASAASPVCNGAPLNCAADVDCMPGTGCKCTVKVEDGSSFCYNYGGFCGIVCATDQDCVNMFGSEYHCLQLDPNGCAQCGGGTTFCGAACGSTAQAAGTGAGPQPR